MERLISLFIPLLLTGGLLGIDFSLYYPERATEAAALAINTFHAPKSSFKAMCFDTPLILEKVRRSKLPVVIFIPASYHGLSPLDEGANWLEGVRVTLAWAGIFAKKLPLYLITMDSEPSLTDRSHLVEQALQQPLPEKIALLEAQSLLKAPPAGRSGSFFPFHVDHAPQLPRRITPLLRKKESSQKRFLISGAIGFIGSHLTKALLDQGHQVIGLDNLSCCSKDNIEPFKNYLNFNFFYHDITRPLEVEGPVDSIIHLASVPSPAFYYSMPMETMTSGLHGTRNMLELAKRKNAQFLFTSTSEVYGDPEISPQHESYAGNVDPLSMRAPYDQSKRGAETLIKLYFEQYRLNVRIARIFNTYGPHMRLDDGRVITNFIQALLNKKPMTIYGSGTQTRSFGYVEDTVEGLLKLLIVPLAPSTPIKERVVNIGTTNEITVTELAETLNTLAQRLNIPPVNISYSKAIDDADPKQRRPDLERARSVLNYEPTISVESGLERTLLYFLKKGEHEA